MLGSKKNEQVDVSWEILYFYTQRQLARCRCSWHISCFIDSASPAMRSCQDHTQKASWIC